MARLSRWAADIDNIAIDGVVTSDALINLAAELGTGTENLYAALVTSEITLENSGEKIQFEICAGGCQQWGALPILEHLIDIRMDRIDDGEPAFAIVAKACLNQCSAAPAVFLVSPQGRALLPAATIEHIDEAIETLLS